MSIGSAVRQGKAHEREAAIEALVDHVARLLAAEYIALMEAAALPDSDEASA